MSEIDFPMDTVDGVSHEALRAVAAGDIDAEGIAAFELARNTCGYEHRRHQRAFIRGYLYGSTGSMEYHASRYQEKLPREEWQGTTDYWSKGFRMAVDESNRKWFKQFMLELDQ